MAVLDEQLGSARTRNDLVHLSEIDEEGAVATHDHRIGLEFVFYLLGGGAEHVGLHLSFV